MSHFDLPFTSSLYTSLGSKFKNLHVGSISYKRVLLFEAYIQHKMILLFKLAVSIAAEIPNKFLINTWIVNNHLKVLYIHLEHKLPNQYVNRNSCIFTKEKNYFLSNISCTI